MKQQIKLAVIVLLSVSYLGLSFDHIFSVQNNLEKTSNLIKQELIDNPTSSNLFERLSYRQTFEKTLENLNPGLQVEFMDEKKGFLNKESIGPFKTFEGPIFVKVAHKSPINRIISNHFLLFSFLNLIIFLLVLIFCWKKFTILGKKNEAQKLLLKKREDLLKISSNVSQKAKNFLLDINKHLNQSEKNITCPAEKSDFDQSNKRILNEINKLTFQLDTLIEYKSPIRLKTANLNLEQIIVTALNDTFEKFSDRYTKDFSVDMNFRESNLIHGNSDAAHLIFELLFELVMEHVESNGLLNISVKNIMSVSNDFVKDIKIVISFSSNNSSSVGLPIKKSPHFLMIRELCKKTNFEINYAADDDFRHFEFNVAVVNARKTSPPKSFYSSYGAFLRDREDKRRYTSWQFDETDLPTTLEIAIISEEHYRFSQIKAAIRSKLPDKIQVNFTELLELSHEDLTTLESCTIIICDCKPDFNYLTKLKIEKKTIIISNDEIYGIKTIPENFDQATWYDHVNTIISWEALK